MSQFAARNQANTLAAPPHAEAGQSSPLAVAQKPKLTAANFRLLKQRLGVKKGETSPPSAPTLTPELIVLPAEPPIVEAGTSDPTAIIAADVEPPEPPPF